MASGSFYVSKLFVAMPVQGSTIHSTLAFEAGVDAEQASHNLKAQCMTERCEPTPFMMKMCVAVVLICINSQPLIYVLGAHLLLIFRRAGFNFEGFGNLWASILSGFGPPF